MSENASINVPIQEEKKYDVSPESFIKALEWYNIFVDHICPETYIVFISDGEFVKITFTKFIGNTVSQIKTGNPHNIEILFAIPIRQLKYRPPDASPYYVRNWCNCKQNARTVINWFFKSYLIRNDWYDLLKVMDFRRYMEMFNISTKEKIPEKKVNWSIYSDRFRVPDGIDYHISPEKLNALLLDYKLPLAKQKIGSFVYFVTDGLYVKIGIANNVTERLKPLRAYNVREFRILFTIPLLVNYQKNGQIMKTVESIVHNVYKDRLVSGEWFDLLPVVDIDSFRKYFGTLTVPGKESEGEYRKIRKQRSA